MTFFLFRFSAGTITNANSRRKEAGVAGTVVATPKALVNAALPLSSAVRLCRTGMRLLDFRLCLLTEMGEEAQPHEKSFIDR